MKKVVILQPSYLPWIGHFNMMLNADVFVYFDNVQYTRRDWRNRNYFLNKDDDKKLLTVPINAKGNYQQNIAQININYHQLDWVKQHLWQLKESYRKADFFEEIFEILSKNLNKKPALLAQLCCDLNTNFAQYLSVNCEIVRSSQLSYNKNFNNASEHLLNICDTLQASHYLSGPASKVYLDTTLFENKNIEVKFHEYQHPIYQQNTLKFTPFLSIVDLLFRYGKQSRNKLFEPQW